MLASVSDVLTNKPFIVGAAITLICIVPSICHYWCKVRRHEVDAQLKHALIERGMSADEIVRVLETGVDGSAEGTDKVDAQFRVNQEVHA
jgi:hypothetical protein